jgi:hypothetical protein
MGDTRLWVLTVVKIKIVILYSENEAVDSSKVLVQYSLNVRD